MKKTSTRVNNLFSTLVVLYTPIIVLGCLVVIAMQITGLPMSWFTRDPLAIVNVNPLTGIVSNIGVLIWSATVSICLFSFVIIFYSKKGKSRYSLFCLTSGIISLVLLLDDFLLFHERIYPGICNLTKLPLSCNENIIYVSYFIMISLYLITFRKTIIKTEYELLILSLIFFAASMAIDKSRIATLILLEDWMKLFGIINWFGYYSRFCYRAINTIFINLSYVGGDINR